MTINEIIFIEIHFMFRCLYVFIVVKETNIRLSHTGEKILYTIKHVYNNMDILCIYMYTEHLY